MDPVVYIPERTEPVPLPTPIPPSISGYMNAWELIWLYNQAIQLHTSGVKGNLLEVGSYKGLSAAALGQAGELTCVDTFMGGDVLEEYDSLPDFKAAMNLMGLQPNIVKGDSRSILPRLKGQFRLILIDGAHGYDVAKEDIKNGWRLLAPGGMLIIDDYVGFEGVQKAADEFAETQGQKIVRANEAHSKMCWLRKPSDQPPLVLLTRVIRGMWETKNVGRFMVGACMSAPDGRYRITTGDVDQEPTSCARNNTIGVGREVGARILVMVDGDMLPSMTFFRYAVEFLLDNPGPVVIGSPYVGAPPDELVHVMRKQAYQPGPEMAINFWRQLGGERVSREEAATLTGIEQVYCVGTGLFAANMEAFDLLDPPQFDYEYEGPERRQASSEDFAFCRRFSEAGGRVYCAWDHWSGHWKEKACLKPEVNNAAYRSTDQRRGAESRSNGRHDGNGNQSLHGHGKKLPSFARK